MRRRTPSTRPGPEHPVGNNVQAIATLEREASDQQTLADRVTAGRFGDSSSTPSLLPIEPGRVRLVDVLLAASVFGGLAAVVAVIVGLARREQLTVRQLLGRLGGGRGHRTFAGTPEQVADTIADWLDNGAADGFNVMPAVLPAGLEAFVEHVIPILQRRGLFRTEYAGPTLRDHYGLPRPGSQFAAAGNGYAPALSA